MSKTKSAATKCIQAKRNLALIKPGLRSAATSMFRGQRAKAINQLSSVLDNAASINGKIRSKALSEFVRKARTFQGKLESMKTIPPVSAKLSKAFDPVFKLAERAVKEAKKESCA